MTQLSEAELAAVRDELARAEIRDAMFRYCRGVDRADRALIRSAYHPDAHDKHGKYDGPSHAFAAAHVARMPLTAEGCANRAQVAPQRDYALRSRQAGRSSRPQAPAAGGCDR